jgi:hypothetical protein
LLVAADWRIKKEEVDISDAEVANKPGKSYLLHGGKHRGTSFFE